MRSTVLYNHSLVVCRSCQFVLIIETNHDSNTYNAKGANYGYETAAADLGRSLLARSARGEHGQLTVNGVQITLGSTVVIALRSPQQMEIANVERRKRPLQWWLTNSGIGF